jgi:hypothetical protein
MNKESFLKKLQAFGIRFMWYVVNNELACDSRDHQDVVISRLDALFKAKKLDNITLRTGFEVIFSDLELKNAKLLIPQLYSREEQIALSLSDE